MYCACTSILMGVAIPVSEILLLSKTVKFSFPTMDYTVQCKIFAGCKFRGFREFLLLVGLLLLFVVSCAFAFHFASAAAVKMLIEEAVKLNMPAQFD